MPQALRPCSCGTPGLPDAAQGDERKATQEEEGEEGEVLVVVVEEEEEQGEGEVAKEDKEEGWGCSPCCTPQESAREDSRGSSRRPTAASHVNTRALGAQALNLLPLLTALLISAIGK